MIATDDSISPVLVCNRLLPIRLVMMIGGGAKPRRELQGRCLTRRDGRHLNHTTTRTGLGAWPGTPAACCVRVQPAGREPSGRFATRDRLARRVAARRLSPPIEMITVGISSLRINTSSLVVLYRWQIPVTREILVLPRQSPNQIVRQKFSSEAPCWKKGYY